MTVVLILVVCALIGAGFALLGNYCRQAERRRTESREQDAWLAKWKAGVPAKHPGFGGKHG